MESEESFEEDEEYSSPQKSCCLVCRTQKRVHSILSEWQSNVPTRNSLRAVIDILSGDNRIEPESERRIIAIAEIVKTLVDVIAVVTLLNAQSYDEKKEINITRFISETAHKYGLSSTPKVSIAC